MNNTLQEDALTVTYYDLEDMINKIVWRFYKIYGGEFDDWKSEAHLIFMKAYNSHNNSQSNFITWLYIRLYAGLKDYYKNFISKSLPSAICRDGFDILSVQSSVMHPFFTMIDLMDELKYDAKTLVELIIDMPEDLRQEDLKICESKYYRGNYAKHMKIWLKNYLRKVGWTHRRITETFIEIGEVIHA
jgi:hypothetical protein